MLLYDRAVGEMDAERPADVDQATARVRRPSRA
jgi:hypothetical protein